MTNLMVSSLMVPSKHGPDSVSKPHRTEQIGLSRKREKFAKSLTYQQPARYSPKTPLSGAKWIGRAAIRKDSRPSRKLRLASRASGWARSEEHTSELQS